jgi:hypothetical protein
MGKTEQNVAMHLFVALPDKDVLCLNEKTITILEADHNTHYWQHS